MAAKHQASPELLARHQAAMQIIQEMDQDERVLLLAYVVAPTAGIREAEEEAKGESTALA
jgi:tellurite resistance protein